MRTTLTRVHVRLGAAMVPPVWRCERWICVRLPPRPHRYAIPTASPGSVLFREKTHRRSPPAVVEIFAEETLFRRVVMLRTPACPVPRLLRGCSDMVQ